MFYTVPTARVIFTVKTSFDVFSLRREHVSTFSVLEMALDKMGPQYNYSEEVISEL